MNLRAKALVILALGLALAPPASSVLSEPDFTLYGNVRVFDAPVAAGTPITLVLGGQAEPLVTYAMESDPSLDGLYALRVPMDSVDPRTDGRARPGEAAAVFIAGQLAAEVDIGAPGTARRLDLDPGNLTGFPNLTVADAEFPEGSTGSGVAVELTVTISTTSGDAVTFDWNTTDGSASAGVCGAGGDYQAVQQGTGTIPAGELATTLPLTLCGDTDIEPNENFTVTLGNLAQANPVDLEAVVTILDDDDIPTITVRDIVVIEPDGASTVAQFTVSLDQVGSDPVRVDYATVDGTALAGVDYEAATGSVSIDPGNPTASIEVTILADGDTEEPETFGLQLSNAVGAGLGTTLAEALIVDPSFDPTVDPVNTLTDGGDVDGLSGAGSVLVLSGDDQVLVSARPEDKLGQFARAPADGSVSYERIYDASSAEAGNALFDEMADLVISTDGRWVFVVAKGEDGVSVYERVAGGLQHRVNSPPDLPSMIGASAASLSPDGRHLYVTAEDQTESALNVFAFDASNPAAPTLTLLEAEREGVDDPDDPGGQVTGLDGAADVAVSPDGRSVYVAGRFDNALVFFERDADPASPGFGELSYRARYVNNQAGVAGLGAPVGLEVSGEGGSVYVIAQDSDALTRFDRDRASGALTFVRAFRSGEDSLFGMENPTGIRLSRDGRLLVVAGFGDDTLVFFDRENIVEHPDFGTLTLADIRRNGEGGLTTLDGPSDIDFSFDDANIYIVSSLGSSLISLERFPRGNTVFGGGFE